MKPETILVTGVLVVLTVTLPRKWVLFPFVAAACMVPMDQRILILDLDFTTLRFVVLAGMIRLYLRGETRTIAWNAFDKLVLTWVVVGSLIYVAQYGTLSSAIYKSGVLYDCLGLYWVFRQVIRTWADVDRAFFLLAIGAILSTPLILMERLTHESLYAYLGTARDAFHRGRYRCSGPFPHFIMMGLFWATVVPVFVSYVVTNKHRNFFLIAAIGAVICLFLSASSTPVMALFAIGVFGMLWKYRLKGKRLAWTITGMILAMHLMMKKPVWHLMSRVNVFSGSTGWHRFILFDRFIQNVGEWWLLGCRGVEHWGIHAGDITNQYVLEGVRGGIVTLVIFVIVIVKAVQTLGACSIKAPTRTRRIICWGICVSMLGHAVAFWGVSYFGQIMMLMYLMFAIAGFGYGWQAELASTAKSRAAVKAQVMARSRQGLDVDRRYDPGFSQPLR